MQLPPNTIIASGPVIIENGKVLLNREIKSDGQASPYFMFPGGVSDDINEPLEMTCRREVKEELGIDINIIRPLRTLIVRRPGKKTYAILVHYLAKRIGEVVPGEETVEWGWYNIHDLPDMCAPNIHEIINDYIKESTV